MREHWYENGSLTKEIIDLLHEEQEATVSGWARPVLIANKHGVYIAPASADPGEGEWLFELSQIRDGRAHPPES